MNRIEVYREIARAAGRLLSDPDKRCVGESACDKLGHFVPPTSNYACRWCVIGALEKCKAESGGIFSRCDLCDFVRHEIGVASLVEAWEGKSADQNAVVQKLLAI